MGNIWVSGDIRCIPLVAQTCRLRAESHLCTYMLCLTAVQFDPIPKVSMPGILVNKCTENQSEIVRVSRKFQPCKLKLGPGNKLTDVENYHNYNNYWFLLINQLPKLCLIIL